MLRNRLIGAVFAVALAFSASAEEVIVRVGPPHDLVERRGPPPSRRHIWIAGYHRWDGRAYAWVPGRWELPPRAHAHWVKHHWVHRRGGYVLVEGHWS
jgi:hypothetical protein